MSKMDPIVNHFWDHVIKHPDDGCWEWQRYRGTGGYGYVRFRGRVFRTHQVSWILTNGEIPDGLWVLHKCDNPPCVRPDHLYIGTRLDNVRDMESRGGAVHPKHEDHPLAKLDWESVRHIRELRSQGMTYSSILKEFPFVALTTIAFVCQRRTWKAA